MVETDKEDTKDDIKEDKKENNYRIKDDITKVKNLNDDENDKNKKPKKAKKNNKKKVTIIVAVVAIILVGIGLIVGLCVGLSIQLFYSILFFNRLIIFNIIQDPNSSSSTNSAPLSTLGSIASISPSSIGRDGMINGNNVTINVTKLSTEVNINKNISLI
jgi:hypothetical protein